MKNPFGFGRKSGKKNNYRNFSDEEYIDEEYSYEEYSEEEYVEEEYAEEEYSGEEYLEEEYSEQEYADEGYYEEAAEEYVEETAWEPAEEIQEDVVSDTIIFEHMEFDEISYDEDEYDADSYEQDETYEEFDYGYENGEEEGLLPAINLSDFIDKLVTIGGVAILIVGLVVGGLFVYNRMNAPVEETFLNVGSQIAQIEVIGQSGLVAVSDAQKAAIEAAKLEEQQKAEEEASKEYEEEAYKTEVNVKLSMSSIEKDLKIKFINQDTGKLVGNVPFGIQVTDPDGKTSFWSDDDMDGIIYKKGLKAGKYKIKVNAFQDVKYKKYGIPTTEHRVEVKANIEYKKVDVANEVKAESQVDVKKEDTKKNETVVEGYLTDTVTWVESTATLVSYTEVAKENIVNPMQLAMRTGFTRLSVMSQVSGSDVVIPTPSPTPEPTVSPTPEPTISPTPSPTVSPTPEPTVSPTPSPTVSPTPEPTVSPTPSPTVSPTPSPTVSPSPSPTISPSPSPTASPTPTPTPKPMVIELDKKTATVYMDIPLALTVTKVENEMENAVITAESSDTNVATVEVQDKVITITGVAPGQASITVKCSAEVKVTEKKEDGTVAETGQKLIFSAEPVVCTVVVKANPQKDTTTVLKDNQDREVYVLENEEYRIAKHADYYTHSKFYIKGAPKYTGWQTLDGKRYYYDAAGKAVTGEQVIQGVKYTFESDGTLVTGSGTLGIDVSKWNGAIDWAQVKNAGVSYVIIRCGYRGSSQGALIKDSKFEENIKGAINAGLQVGVYFFSQAVDKNEAVEEASMVLDCVRNYKISYPIFLDVEPSGGRADSIDMATRTEICQAFCKTIQSYGYTAGIYANKTWFETKINTGSLSGSYKIWLAQYASEPTYAGRYDMWQYKSTGTISGISGEVDMNLSYLGY